MQLLTVSSQIKNPLTAGGRIVDVVLEVWAVIVVAGSAGAIATLPVKLPTATGELVSASGWPLPVPPFSADVGRSQRRRAAAASLPRENGWSCQARSSAATLPMFPTPEPP